MARLVMMTVLAFLAVVAPTSDAQTRTTPLSTEESAKLRGELQKAADTIHATLPSPDEVRAMQRSAEDMNARLKDLGASTLKLQDDLMAACVGDPACKHKMDSDRAIREEIERSQQDLKRSISELNRVK